MKKKYWYGIIGCIMILILSISYAYWSVYQEQNGTNQMVSGCFDLTLTSESKEIKLENAYPIANEEGMKLEPYTFTITNTCSTFLSYEILFNILSTSSLNSRYVAAVINRNAVKRLSEYESKEMSGYLESRVLQSGSLSPNDSETFHLRIWMEESVEGIESMNKSFQGKIGVLGTASTYSPVEVGFQTLAEAMIVNEYQSSSVEKAKEMIEEKQAPDFSKTAPIIHWQEQHEMSSVIRKILMPHPDKVGEYQGFHDVTQSYIWMSHQYEFDSETGYYTLIDPILVDPTTITNYDTKDYYYCSAGINITLNDVIGVTFGQANCSSIYKVKNVTKENSEQTGPSGKVFQMIQYNIEAYPYRQRELESDGSDKGLYMALDDDGKSYYYRGNVNNNYVKFAGFYWRIIRLNGDGSVRLLYAGESSTSSGSELFIQQEPVVFQDEQNTPGYVGYMYGNNLDTYENATKNEKNSTIKTVLDNWYQEYIVGHGYENKVADSIFCNDREIYSGDGFQVNKTTIYKPYQRLVVDKNPTLYCQQMNDRFTVNVEKGNGALTYPIGLITLDELMYAGMAAGGLNKKSYIYSSENYWTMTPTRFFSNVLSAQVHTMFGNGYVDVWSAVNSLHGVRPVINLDGNVIITGGIGSFNQPFIVQS